MALRLTGPLLGFLMSTAFLKYYENPFDDPGFGPEDPRWIGAWWMGFFVQGVLIVIFSIPILFFPKRLPSHRKLEHVPRPKTKETAKELFKGLFPSVKKLAKNQFYVILIFSMIVVIYGHAGHAIMVPKYMENQFRISASDASLYSGATEIVIMMASIMLGGLLVWKFRPSAKKIFFLAIITETIFALGYLVMMIPRCDKHQMMNFGADRNGLILDSICNQNCNCTTTAFTPYCGSDGKTLYFSPCHAGCTRQLQSVASIAPDKEFKKFGNCSCVSNEFGSSGGTITEGYCVDDSCWDKAKVYIGLLLALEFVGSFLKVAGVLILLRSVHPDDKSIALGASESLLCLFGFLPFPVIFGAIVDSACIVWQRSCGKTGNCWFYELEAYNYTLHGVSAVFCGVAVLCFIILYFLSGRIRNLYEEEDEPNEQHIHLKLDAISEPGTNF